MIIENTWYRDVSNIDGKGVIDNTAPGLTAAQALNCMMAISENRESPLGISEIFNCRCWLYPAVVHRIKECSLRYSVKIFKNNTELLKLQKSIENIEKTLDANLKPLSSEGAPELWKKYTLDINCLAEAAQDTSKLNDKLADAEGRLTPVFGQPTLHDITKQYMRLFYSDSCIKNGKETNEARIQRIKELKKSIIDSKFDVNSFEIIGASGIVRFPNRFYSIKDHAKAYNVPGIDDQFFQEIEEKQKQG